VEDSDGSYAETLKSQPEQTSRVEFEEFRVEYVSPERLTPAEPAQARRSAS